MICEVLRPRRSATWRGKESLLGAVGLFHAVYQLRGKMMPAAVQTFLLYPCGLENPVVPFAEVHRAGIVAFLVAYKGRIWTKIPFLRSSLPPVSGIHALQFYPLLRLNAYLVNLFRNFVYCANKFLNIAALRWHNLRQLLNFEPL